MRVVCLAGGVGGAKLAEGLQAAVAPGDLTMIVNTGDDLERHSLAICPDLDTVTYTLAGVAGPEGWGLSGESWNVMSGLSRLGEKTWFRLGDRDIATHLFRTERLRAGRSLTEVTAELVRGFGIPSHVLPMTDDPVHTRVRTDGGWLAFQDYFVRLHQEPEVREVEFDGIEKARLTDQVRDAIRAAEAIVIGPSNPIVSVGPILAVRGLADEIRAARKRGVRGVGLSGIIGGKALRGPADRMLASLGFEASAVGVARQYAGRDLLDAFVIDTTDADLGHEVHALGLEPAVTGTVMTDMPSRVRVAREILRLAASAA
jgi:LPPG:FO 2-phospho-L-lactate transferase